MKKSIIVAVADNMAIGKGNQIPWHISDDLKNFKHITLGHPVIMGRKTYESIGRPLPQRMNIVLSHNDHKYSNGVIGVKSLDSAYTVASTCADYECFIIGGTKLYETAIDGVNKLYVTHVRTVIEDADAFFPEIDDQTWYIDWKSEERTDPESGLKYQFVIYKRYNY